MRLSTILPAALATLAVAAPAQSSDQSSGSHKAFQDVEASADKAITELKASGCDVVGTQALC